MDILLNLHIDFSERGPLTNTEPYCFSKIIYPCEAHPRSEKKAVPYFHSKNKESSLTFGEPQWILRFSIKKSHGP